MPRLSNIAIGASIALIITQCAHAAVWTVDDDGADFPSADFTDIQSAVDAAANGDEVLVYPGTYRGAGTWVVELGYQQSIWLHSVGGAAVTIIDGQFARTCYRNYFGDSTLEGFTLTNGYAIVDGGGAKLYGGTIKDCIITGNSADENGGGVLCGYNTSVTIEGCTVTENGGHKGGGVAVEEYGIVTISDCTLSNNTAQFYGGGFYGKLSNNVTMNNCTIAGNIAVRDGGGLCGDTGSNVIMNNCNITSNAASRDGGGLFLYDNATATANNCDISSNSAVQNAGGIHTNSGDTVLCTGCTIENNTAGTTGGVLCDAASWVFIDMSTLCGNSPNNIAGPWTEVDDVCLAISCQDNNGNGTPDECDTTTGLIHVPDDYPTIQAAIDAAFNGDTILVGPGTWVGTGNEVCNTLGKAIIIRSTNGSGTTIINGQGQRRGITCTNGEALDTIIDGFTISNGLADVGGGVSCVYTSPTIINCVIQNNVATGKSLPWHGGGGVYLNNSNAAISNCTIDANTATEADVSGGGVFCSGGVPEITNCTISNNIADCGGGMTVLVGAPVISVCNFTENVAVGTYFSDGGGLLNYKGSPVLTQCTMTLNLAQGQGWGGGMSSIGGNLIVSNCDFSNNEGRNGGGAYLDTGTEVLIGCDFLNNTAVQGGGTYCSGSQTTFTNCTFDGNDGGGVQCVGYTSTTLVECQINNNRGGLGAGLCASGSVTTLVDCVLYNNQLTEGPAWGGGVCIRLEGTLSLSGCTIQGNWVNMGRGSTISRGGGIMCMESSFASLDNCVIGNNSAALGDGVMVEDASIVSWSGANTVTGDSLYCEDAGSIMQFAASSLCLAGVDVTPSLEGGLLFDVDDLSAAAALYVSNSLLPQGGMALTNDSGSLSGAQIGDVIPLATAGVLIGSFDSIVLPVMPEGLGLELIEQGSLRGGDTTLAVEVVGVDDVDFASPFDAAVDSVPMDIVAFDVNDDGVDEIAVLFGGSPGGVAVFSVSADAAPVVIASLSELVGNNPVDLDAGDLDGDGLDDLVVVNSTDLTLSVLLADTAGGLPTFAVSTIFAADGNMLTCGAITDWDGDTMLDAVVGIDNGVDQGAWQVVLDLADVPATGSYFQVPYFIIDDVEYPDPPQSAAGSTSETWGFAGGTQYGRVQHSSEDSGVLTTLAELGINAVNASDVLDIDGDGQLDIVVASADAQAIYMLPGDAAAADGFGDLIPCVVSEPVEDFALLDADTDGDMDMIIASPTSANYPLLLLRNDGASGSALAQPLGGLVWSMQSVGSGGSPSRLASGKLNNKDDDDDWVVGGGGESGLVGEAGVLEQTNLLNNNGGCPEDIDGNGTVNIDDLLLVLGNYNGTGEGDVDGNGVVNIDDMLLVIGAWNTSC